MATLDSNPRWMIMESPGEAPNSKDHVAESPITTLTLSLLPINNRTPSNEVEIPNKLVQGNLPAGIKIFGAYIFPDSPKPLCCDISQKGNIDNGEGSPVTTLTLGPLPNMKRPRPIEDDDPRKCCRINQHDPMMTKLVQGNRPSGIKIFGDSLHQFLVDVSHESNRNMEAVKVRKKYAPREIKHFSKTEVVMNKNLPLLELAVFPLPPENQNMDPEVQLSIKKNLTASDVSKNLHRLVLPKNMAELLLSQWADNEAALRIEESGSKGKIAYVRVVMHDKDTRTSFDDLVMTRWGNRSYNIQGGWYDHFVTRRDLKEHDVIGLSWDRAASNFVFQLISRAPATFISPLI